MNAAEEHFALQLNSNTCLQTSLIIESLYLLFYEFASAAAILKVRI